MVSHRQRTLSLPRALRLVVVKEPRLFKLVERTLVRAVWRWQRSQARRLGVRGEVKSGVALLPPAHKHLTTFHGVYAPNASLRPVVMRPAPEAPERRPSPSQLELRLVGPADDAPAPASPKRQSSQLDWATLQARTFGTDVWSCPCGGRRRVLAVVSSPNTAQTVLQRLGLLEPRRASRSHGPAPPQLSLPL